MLFRDQLLLRLTHRDERATLLTPEVGRAVLEAAYQFEAQPLGAVSSIVTRGWELAPGIAEASPVEAQLFQPQTGMRWELSGTIERTAAAGPDAHLDLVITATTRPVVTSIEAVATESLARLGDLRTVDARIVAQDGALPADAPAHDARRLTEMSEMLREALDQPADFDAADFLRAERITSTDAFLGYLRRRGAAMRVALDVAVVPTAGLESRSFAVSLFLLVREANALDLREAVSDVQVLRARLARSGRGGGVGRDPEPRSPFPVLLVYPEAILDDADLPLPAGVAPASAGAARTARLGELNRRLRTLAISAATA